MAFLELDGVHKQFGANHVLRGVDLHVDEHDVVTAGKLDRRFGRQRLDLAFGGFARGRWY